MALVKHKYIYLAHLWWIFLSRIYICIYIYIYIGPIAADCDQASIIHCSHVMGGRQRQ